MPKTGIVRFCQGRLDDWVQTVEISADGIPTLPGLRGYLAFPYCEQGREAEAWRELGALAEDEPPPQRFLLADQLSRRGMRSPA